MLTNKTFFGMTKEELFIKQFGRKYNKKIACIKIMDTLKEIIKETENN